MPIAGRKTADPGGASAPIRSDCLASDAVGDFVYVTADKINGRLQVAKTDITNISKTPVVGIITSKPASTVCDVQTGGSVVGIYTGLTPQEVLFVGADSRLTETSPEPGVGVTFYIQAVGVALASDEFVLHVAKIPIKRVGE